MEFLVFAALLGVMYLVLILPQQRRARRHQELLSALDVGDEVMTTAGLYGIITDLDSETAQLEIADGIEVKIARGSIGRRLTEPEAHDADDLDDDFDPDDDLDDADDELDDSADGIEDDEE